jgi:hypothetical protein
MPQRLKEHQCSLEAEVADGGKQDETTVVSVFWAEQMMNTACTKTNTTRHCTIRGNIKNYGAKIYQVQSNLS